jgi:hypothetical protein
VLAHELKNPPCAHTLGRSFHEPDAPADDPAQRQMREIVERQKHPSGCASWDDLVDISRITTVC